MRLSAAGVDALRSRAQQDVDSGVLPSCQFALALDGQVLVSETLGDAPADARYAIWSCTKPVFASVAWQLMGEGELLPATPVVELWPQFGAHGKDGVTVEQLLTFTAGFPDAELDLVTIDDRDARTRQIEDWRLAFEPGTAYAYHSLSAHWVLAELVSRVTGTDHRVALRERVLDPLGLDRLELGVSLERQGDVQRCRYTGEVATPVEIAAALGLPALPAEVVALLDSAAAGTGLGGDLLDLQQPHVRAAGIPGAGAVSDAASLALFYQHLLNDPKAVWDPVVLLDAKTNVRNRFVSDFLDVIAMRTIGLEVQGDDPTSRHRSGSGHASPQTFGHAGAFGQIAWADPVTGLSFVYLTDGCDRHAVRQARRVRELAAAAVACVL